MTKSLRVLRIVGYCEGMSFLLLLGVAMPLKYAAGQPLGVQIVGSLHGGLWILYILTAIVALKSLRQSLLKIALAFVASVLPFGPFVFDAWVIRQEQSTPGRDTTPS